MNKALVHILSEFFLSQIKGLPIHDQRGRFVGKLCDLALRWERQSPRVTGIKYKKGLHTLIPVDRVARLSLDRIELKGPFTPEDLITLQPDEIYMGKWLMDKQIIDLKGSKVVRVNDIKLYWLQSGEQRHLVPAAVDIGLRGLARRLGVEFLCRKLANQFVWWEFIQALEEKTADLQLVRDRQQLDQMHPADLADILEALDYKTRSDVIEDLDVETVAEAFAEMDRDAQLEALEQMDNRQASNLLEEMPPDEAADLLGELPEDKSEELLQLMEPDEAQERRVLMDYEEGTAGALMTTEYLALSPDLTAGEAIAALRELAQEAETIYYLYLLGEDQTLSGVLSLRELIVTPPQAKLADLMQTRIISVLAEDEQEKVADLLNKYSLLAIPVLTPDQRMQGIITVDDVLEFLLPDRSTLETFSNFFVSKRSGRG